MSRIHLPSDSSLQSSAPRFPPGPHPGQDGSGSGDASLAAKRGTGTAAQWRQALAQARCAPERELLKSHLLHLASWPPLTRLPPDVAAPVARICALLWQKRTAGFLVPKVLGMPSEDAMVLLHALRSLGHVSAHLPPGTSRTGALPASTADPEATRPMRRDSLLDKLWHRLTAPLH